MRRHQSLVGGKAARGRGAAAVVETQPGVGDRRGSSHHRRSAPTGTGSGRHDRLGDEAARAVADVALHRRGVDGDQVGDAVATEIAGSETRAAGKETGLGRWLLRKSQVA